MSGLVGLCELNDLNNGTILIQNSKAFVIPFCFSINIIAYTLSVYILLACFEIFGGIFNRRPLAKKLETAETAS